MLTLILRLNLDKKIVFKKIFLKLKNIFEKTQ